MQIINNVNILCIVKTAINQWKWWSEIKISNGLKEINVLINKIDEQSVKRRDSGDTAYLNGVQTNSHSHRSPQTLIY